MSVSESAGETGSKGNQGWGGSVTGSATRDAATLTVGAEAWDDDGQYGSSAAATSIVAQQRVAVGAGSRPHVG